MGAYLSQPNTEKETIDKDCPNFSYGASSMQGWRISQEDAHNCEPEFDGEKQSSLFAVYDGHGGAEVSKYVSLHLPRVLKARAEYGEGDLGVALQKTFLQLDSQILEEEAQRELKRIANAGKDDSGAVDDDEEDEEEVSGLYQDANLPIEEVMKRYGKDAPADAANAQQLLSPAIKPKRPPLPFSGGSGDSADVKSSPDEKPGPSGDASSDTAASSSAGGASDVTNDSAVVTANSSSEGDDKPGGSASSDGPAGNNGAGGACSDTAGGCGSSSADGNSGAGGSGSSGAGGGSGDVPAAGGSGCSSADPGPGGSGGPAAARDSEDEDDSDLDSSDEELQFPEDMSDEDDDDDDIEETAMPPMRCMVSDREEPGFDSGTTAVVAVMRGQEIVVANAGDSRCVLCRDGKAFDLSEDHKPEDEPEKTRIEKAGGQVTADGRVSGGLNLSRAIGDHSYKQNTSLGPEEQMISVLPEIKTATLSSQDPFLVLACDGIWNSLTSQEVVDFVSKRLEANKDVKLSDVCNDLFNRCMAPDTCGDGTGCDNMTCIIVRFKHPLTANGPATGSSDGETKRARSPDGTSPDVNGPKKAKVGEGESS